jgi:hypothetical protein
VALGAAAAPQVHAGRLIAALGAFLLAVGVSAHALDELNGRPLRTALTRRSLIALAIVSPARSSSRLTTSSLPEGDFTTTRGSRWLGAASPPSPDTSSTR